MLVRCMFVCQKVGVSSTCVPALSASLNPSGLVWLGREGGLASLTCHSLAQTRSLTLTPSYAPYDVATARAYPCNAPALRCCSCALQTRWTPSRGRCWTAWRSSGSVGTRRVSTALQVWQALNCALSLY